MAKKKIKFTFYLTDEEISKLEAIKDDKEISITAAASDVLKMALAKKSKFSNKELCCNFECARNNLGVCMQISETYCSQKI